MNTEQKRTFAVVLAAGNGKRMKSDQPKVLSEVLFQPMLKWVENACREAGIDEIYIVAGEQEELLREVCPGCGFVHQQERRGTGHAVKMAAQALAGGGEVLVLNGDAPFISAEVITQSLVQHRAQGNAVTVITARVPDPAGYGRILRNERGGVSAIVEHADATEDLRRINEINSGAYWFDAVFLAGALERLTCHNAQGEYYLTDIVKIAAEDHRDTGGYTCPNGDVILGANDRKSLKMLNEIARNREIERHLDNGVDIPWDDGVIIGVGVSIAHDARILPGTILKGNTVIGAHAVIGPNSNLTDSIVGEGTQIISSYLTDSTVGDGSSIGPFTQLRPGSHVGNQVKIGDFVELKNSSIGDRTSIAHLTYIGDSDVGQDCNFGCGVVTANYNGKEKFRSAIGNRAFIGCNTNLISPVRIGEGAYTAAGTTIAGEVPAGALAIGRPETAIKEHWADRHIGFKAKK